MIKKRFEFASFFFFFGCCFFSFLDLAFERERERERGRGNVLQAASQLFFHCKASIREFWFLMGKKNAKTPPYDD